MKKLVLFFVLLSASFPCVAVYECWDRGRMVLSSAPCDTGFPPPWFSLYSAQITSVRIPMENNAYRISGTVQGVPVVHLVDTGATHTAINKRVATAAGITCQSAGVSRTANGTVGVCISVASEITFGGMKVKNVVVTVMPNMSQDVLLGMNVLEQFKISQGTGFMQISR